MAGPENDQSFTELEDAIGGYHHALDVFVTGDPEPQKKMFSTSEDVTLGNPLGPPGRGRAAVEGIMDRAAALLRDGEPTTFERISGHAVQDMAYIVEIERTRAKVAGSDELTPIALRVTTVFCKDNGQWKVRHRHADPIVSARPVESIIQA